MPDVMIAGYECARCGHQWAPRNKASRPIVCPKCKSPYWDSPKRSQTKREVE